MNDSDNNPDVGRNLMGYPYNKKYPPVDFSKGNLYHGYSDSFRETLFYDFAVLGYDLEFSYKGTTYHVTSDGADGVWLSDPKFTAKLEHFPSGNAFLENFRIDGHRLIDLIDRLDDVQPI